ncbi:MAG: transglutaminase-like domain-containing protein [Armatimonadota bacterium]
MLSLVKMAKNINKTTITLASAAVIAGSPAVAQHMPADTWMGIYLGASKMGHARMSISQANYKGKPGYKLDTLSVTRLVALGEQIEQSVDTVVYLDKKSAPLFQTFKMTSSGHTTTITARYSPKEIVAQVVSDGTKSTSKIPIPAGCKLVGDSTFFSPTMSIKVGDTMDLKCFNPLTLSLDDIQTTVLRREDLLLDGKSYQTFVIKSTTPLGEMICWQDDKGEILKVTALMGISMIKESKETAIAVQSDSYHPTPDLAVMTSAQSSVDIPNPRQIRHLRIRMDGLADKTLIISDYRQKAVYGDLPQPFTEFDITSSDFDPSRSISLPVSDQALSGYLADTPYVQPDNPEIIKIAKEVAGDEKNAYLIAARLREWVYRSMTTKGNIGIVRSSVDVLHAKEGVCRDYAILYAALARAVGIPTKVVAGLLYWKNGFYYHAWAESFVGEWVPIDATLSMNFVDATHIKLSEGDATDMFASVKTMGSLKAAVLDFK